MHDEMDILREVGSIAAAHGGTALSEILGRRINIHAPSVESVPCCGISKKINLEAPGIAVVAKLSSGLKGQSSFVLEEKNAFKLIGLSCKIGKKDKKSDVLTEIGISTLKEIGNIVINSYLSAIAMMLKRVVLSLPPTLISGTVDEIMNIIISSPGTQGNILLIKAAFDEPKSKIKGTFSLVLAPETASEIYKVCKEMLEELKYA